MLTNWIYKVWFLLGKINQYTITLQSIIMKKLIINPVVLGLTVIAVIFLTLHLTHFNDLNFTR